MMDEARKFRPAPCVWVVDDTPDNLYLMAALLEDRYRVRQMASGADVARAVNEVREQGRGVAAFFTESLLGSSGGVALPAGYLQHAYAAGWDVATRPWAGGITLSHSGSNTMNLVTTWIAPAKGLVMMVATNAATSGADIAVDAAFAPMVERFTK